MAAAPGAAVAPGAATVVIVAAAAESGGFSNISRRVAVFETSIGSKWLDVASLSATRLEVSDLPPFIGALDRSGITDSDGADGLRA